MHTVTLNIKEMKGMLGERVASEILFPIPCYQCRQK